VAHDVLCQEVVVVKSATYTLCNLLLLVGFCVAQALAATSARPDQIQKQVMAAYQQGRLAEALALARTKAGMRPRPSPPCNAIGW
jgi:hypothetical protein